MANDDKKGNPPVFKKNSGLTSTAVFQNERKTKDGKVFTATDVSMSQGYVDKDGNIKPTKSMSVNQGLRAHRLLGQALDEAMDLRRIKSRGKSRFCRL